MENGPDQDRTALIFLGTGCSRGVPYARCLIQPSDPPCHIILTHEHTDAVHGLDDIRSVQPRFDEFLRSIARRFPYLVQEKLKEGQVGRRVSRFNWRIIEENCGKPFAASGLSFDPSTGHFFLFDKYITLAAKKLSYALKRSLDILLQVMHGEDYVALGFLFGQKSKVAYISDVSRIPPSTEYAISKAGAGQVDLLILDTHSTQKRVSCSTHICSPKALEIVKRLCPKRALLTGMTHEYDHHKHNEVLMEWSQREGIQVQLAHDGLRVRIDL